MKTEKGMDSSASHFQTVAKIRLPKHLRWAGTTTAAIETISAGNDVAFLHDAPESHLPAR
jgi:hypothetical protein